MFIFSVKVDDKLRTGFGREVHVQKGELEIANQMSYLSLINFDYWVPCLCDHVSLMFMYCLCTVYVHIHVFISNYYVHVGIPRQELPLERINGTNIPVPGDHTYTQDQG